ncbi:SMC family ATPase, partial [Candidatus Bathyarchaeota archaeon]|nr:SMC family ATPase [Candidatus Bathyarchaeota archaeon]
MPFSIISLSAEGIRGINERFECHFNEGANLLYGPNGVGKSSLLQAIEWCLTGELPYLTGPDFRLEDAIVNLFHPEGKAIVSLTLSDGTREIVVTRSRRRGKSTTRGKSDLEVRTHEGRILREDSAQAFINGLMGLSPEDFPRTIYLHQEAIRALLSESSEERSRAIDELLGLGLLRDLVEVLEERKKIPREIRAMERQIEALERDRIQFTEHLKERMEKERETLISKGCRKSDLEIPEACINIGKLLEGVSKLAEDMRIPMKPRARPEPSLASLEEALSNLEKDLDGLSEARVKALIGAETMRLRLEGASKGLHEARERLKGFGPMSLESLDAKVRGLEAKIQDLRTKRLGLEALKRTVSGAIHDLERLEESIGMLQSRIDEIVEKWGDEGRHEGLLEELRLRLEDIRGKIGSFSSLDQIVSSAIKYLSEVKPRLCPVCIQPIDHRKVLEGLRRQESETAAKIAELRKEEASILDGIRSLETSLRELRDLRERLKDFEERARKMRSEAEGKIGRPLEEDFLVRLEGELEGIDAQIGAEEKSLREARELLEGFRTALRELETSQRHLQALMGSSSVDEALLMEAEDRIRNLQEVRAKLERSEELERLKESLGMMREIVAYLRDGEEVKAAERELPRIRERIRDLKARIDSLKQLERTLATISEAAASYGREASTSILRTVEGTLNEYYRSLLSHPYFSSLRITIEKEIPLQYSIKAFGAEESTYISTRFSNAQMNAVALALLLSNHSKPG